MEDEMEIKYCVECGEEASHEEMIRGNWTPFCDDRTHADKHRPKY